MLPYHTKFIWAGENAHRDKSTNKEAGEVVTFYSYQEKVTLKFETGSIKKSLIIKVNTVFFLLKFFEK